MRISDWSSDVCSSDLPRSQGGSDRHAEEGDAIGKAIRQLVESTDPMTGVVGIGGEEYRLPILSIRAHEIVEPQVQRRPTLRRSGESDEPRRSGRRTPDGNSTGLARPPREHTISQPVFGIERGTEVRTGGGADILNRET